MVKNTSTFRGEKELYHLYKVKERVLYTGENMTLVKMGVNVVKQRRNRGSSCPDVYLVYKRPHQVGDEPIGYLEKYRNTRTDVHPWKSFTFRDQLRPWYNGAFYDDPSRFPAHEEVKGGGKEAALKAILGD